LQLAVLTAIFKLIETHHHIKSPFATIKKFVDYDVAEAKQIRRPFTAAELAKIETFINAKAAAEPHNQAIAFWRVAFVLGLEAALRIEDVILLKKSAIHGQRLHVTEAKTGKEMIKTAPKTIAAIEDYLMQFGTDGEYIFAPQAAAYAKRQKSCSQYFQVKILKACGLDTMGKNTNSPELSYHSFRHTMASRMMAAGCAMEDVSEYIGHSNPKITGIYVSNDTKTALKIAKADKMYGVGTDLQLEAKPKTFEDFFKENEETIKGFSMQDKRALAMMIIRS
jgi:integrase